MSTPLTRRRVALEDVNTVERNVQRPLGTASSSTAGPPASSTTTDP